jgi:hypothetical protein
MVFLKDTHPSRDDSGTARPSVIGLTLPVS